MIPITTSPVSSLIATSPTARCGAVRSRRVSRRSPAAPSTVSASPSPGSAARGPGGGSAASARPSVPSSRQPQRLLDGVGQGDNRLVAVPGTRGHDRAGRLDVGQRLGSIYPGGSVLLRGFLLPC